MRRPKRDGARYFGPYPSGTAAKETLRFLQSILHLRTCRDRELKTRSRPCLEFEIGRCCAPCVGRIEPADYQGLVKDGVAFLEGRERALIGDLRNRMNEASEELRFEEAAALRDRIAAIEETLEKQRIVSKTGRNRDVFGLCREGDLTQIALLFVRGGRMIGQKTFAPIRLRVETGEVLSSLLLRYYDGVADIPDEVLVPMPLEDGEALAEWLAEKRGRGVNIVSPKRGEGLALAGIAGRNAENALRNERLAADRPEEAVRLLAGKLKLRSVPQRIECFDISNMAGKYAVGSMVTFAAGVPAKEGYRRFRIRTVSGADDYAMMYEVLKRRYEKRENLPDLIVVDGGKGQLGVALAVLKDLGIEGPDVLGLAKERDEEQPEVRHGVMEKEEDRVYLPGRKDPVFLSRWPSALFLLQRIRDEAHRFAIAYHRKVKRKEDLQSLLDRIPGIGPARRKALLVFFGDLKRVRAASIEDLQRVEGIGGETARRIRAFLDGEAAASKGGTDGGLSRNS